MRYANLKLRLDDKAIVVLDGGTGTELERRGVTMDPGAWCGAASLAHGDILQEVHRDFIAVGADIITANTFASSALMLEAAGLAGNFEEINRAAIDAALRASKRFGNSSTVVAGSLSHMIPAGGGSFPSDAALLPSQAEMSDAFGALAALLKAEGCDLILLEMMHHPDRMPLVFAAAQETGLPIWAGFSARRGANGEIFSFTTDRDVPFAETVKILDDYEVDVAGIMHTSPNVTGDALAILRQVYNGPFMAYPDSGYFKMPNWQFEDVIQPREFYAFAEEWVAQGVQVIGGCCGLSPMHIAAVASLKKYK